MSASGPSSSGSSTARAPTPVVVVITGTSGAGKGTLEKALLLRMPMLELAVSATTRKQRPGEQGGREYWFVSDAEFDEKLEAGEFLEWVEFPWGQRSGTLRSEIDRIAGGGRTPLLDLETEGALRVQKRVPGATTVFVNAPTFEELERRLRARATESAGEITERLALAHEQLTLAGEFDYVVVNDDVARATDELEGIVSGALAASGTISRP